MLPKYFLQLQSTLIALNDLCERSPLHTETEGNGRERKNGMRLRKYAMIFCTLGDILNTILNSRLSAFHMTPYTSDLVMPLLSTAPEDILKMPGNDLQICE